ncbi:MAG: GNAT family N-acetyltransferase [Sphingobacteriaceae bacterium]|nr:GNAT family N-acetyltransferase [Sphingobacteriaceae bacterium]
MLIRRIEKKDNLILSDLIKSVFREFNIAMPGTVYYDPSTDLLFEHFQNKKAILLIAEEHHEIVGACGIYPTDGLEADCAELVKFYLSPQGRNKGIGKRLLQACLKWSKENGYNKIYLECFPELETAIEIYKKYGWKSLDKPLGNSGHHACSVWMIKELD